MVTIGAFVWAVFTYTRGQEAAQKAEQIRQKRDNATRLLEARKPFLNLQLETYCETAKVIGQIVTLTPELDSERDKWVQAEKRFWQLFYAELSLVEDKTVKEKMEKFSCGLDQYNLARGIIDPEKRTSAIKKTGKELSDLSHPVSNALKESIINSWSLSTSDESQQPATEDTSVLIAPRGRPWIRAIKAREAQLMMQNEVKEDKIAQLEKEKAFLSEAGQKALEELADSTKETDQTLEKLEDTSDALDDAEAYARKEARKQRKEARKQRKEARKQRRIERQEDPAR
jgi:hypothetical protein